MRFELLDEGGGAVACHRPVINAIDLKARGLVAVS
jgi:hypothetical protein